MIGKPNWIHLAVFVGVVSSSGIVNFVIANEPNRGDRAYACAGKHRISAKPITIRLKTSADILKRIVALSTDKAGSVRLSVLGIAPPEKPSIAIRVFLNNPKADIDTKVSDPSYVGSFSFFPSPAEPEQKIHFHLNAAPSIRRLYIGSEPISKTTDPLMVTLFAVPIRAGQRIDHVAIPFDRIELRDVTTEKP